MGAYAHSGAEKQTEEGAAVVLSPERRSQEERKGGRTDGRTRTTHARTDALNDGRSQPSLILLLWRRKAGSHLAR